MSFPVLGQKIGSAPAHVSGELAAWTLTEKNKPLEGFMLLELKGQPRCGDSVHRLSSSHPQDEQIPESRKELRP